MKKSPTQKFIEFITNEGWAVVSVSERDLLEEGIPPVTELKKGGTVLIPPSGDGLFALFLDSGTYIFTYFYEAHRDGFRFVSNLYAHRSSLFMLLHGRPLQYFPPSQPGGKGGVAWKDLPEGWDLSSGRGPEGYWIALPSGRAGSFSKIAACDIRCFSSTAREDILEVLPISATSEFL